MKDNNTLSKFEYVIWSLLYSTGLLVIYKSLIYKDLPQYNHLVSEMIFIGIIAVSMMTFIWLTWNRRRNFVSVVINALTPIVVYTLMAYADSLKGFIICVSVVVAGLGLFYSLPMVFRKFRNAMPIEKKFSVVFNRIRYSLLGMRTIAVVCFMSIVVYAAINPVSTEVTAMEQTLNTTYETSKEEICAEYKEQLKKLSISQTEQITDQEKMEVLQTLCDVESRSHGSSGKITLVLQDLDGTVWGEYSHEDRIVYVDTEHFYNDSIETIAFTVLHECYHNYQHLLVDAYNELPEEDKKLNLFRSVRQYKYELDNYYSPPDERYYTQLLETEANAYAKHSITWYYEQISKY